MGNGFILWFSIDGMQYNISVRFDGGIFMDGPCFLELMAKEVLMLTGRSDEYSFYLGNFRIITK